MAEVFNWIRPGYELVTVRFEWNVQVPFLQTRDGNGNSSYSPLFSPQETPNSKWELGVHDDETHISIHVYHISVSAGVIEEIFEPIRGKMSILDKRGKKVLQTISSADVGHRFRYPFSKEEIIQSKSQQSKGNLSFYFKMFTHVKKELELSTLLDGLFNNMPLSDVNFHIGGREFPAHKVILAARSQYFDAMFQHPMKEQSTNQIEIEGIEPEVFDQLLRFIYTGRVSTATIESMAAKLFIAADKYLLDELKNHCENYLVHHMTSENCVFLLLHGDLQNPTQPLYEAVTFFRRYPNEVTATERWKKMKHENPVLLCHIQQFVLCNK